jgi:hypothetical protein
MIPKIFIKGRERRSKPFVLLDISLLRIRLHLIDAAKDPVRIKLLREEYLAPGDSLQLAQIVRKTLDVSTDIRDLAIVMNSPAIRHQVISIPPMRGVERHKVLLREMKHSSPSKEETGSISYWSTGKIKEASVVREHVLCAEMNSSIADVLIEAVREKNFNLIGFTSYAQMASQLLKECRQENGRNIALLEASGRECSITLFRSIAWNMDRHFLIGGAGSASTNAELSESDAEKLKMEVGRALQYFKQQVRNENISQIVIFGDTGQAADIKKLLEASFRIPVVPLIREGKRFAAGDSAGQMEHTSPLFEIVHVAALYSEFEKYINFLPPELHLQKHARSRQLALAGSAVAMYALMAGGAYIVNREASRIIARAPATIQIPIVNEPATPKANDLQISRGFALAVEQSDEWLRNKHHLLAELVRELAGAAPVQMRISGLEVTGMGNVWKVKLDAEIRSANGTHSQKLLLKFQEQVRDLLCLKQLKWGDVQLTDLEPSIDSGVSQNNLLTFTLSGTLNPDTRIPQ